MDVGGNSVQDIQNTGSEGAAPQSEEDTAACAALLVASCAGQSGM